MNIRTLLPKFDIPVSFKELDGCSGEYWYKSDTIIIDSALKKEMPGCAKLVVLHELIHATGSKKRLMRIHRLSNIFGPYAPGSMTEKMEECIAEIGSMVIAMKLGLFNEYTKSIILKGMEDFYTTDMYIPIREIRAAVKYFADDDTDFELEIKEAKEYLEAYLEVKFQDSYAQSRAAS